MEIETDHRRLYLTASHDTERTGLYVYALAGVWIYKIGAHISRQAWAPKKINHLYFNRKGKKSEEV